jgi:hypothetical protein
MPEYMPSFTSDGDGEVHLYRNQDAQQSLCGKPRGAGVSSPKGKPVCAKCGRRLLVRIFESSDQIGSFDIVVH